MKKVSLLIMIAITMVLVFSTNAVGPSTTDMAKVDSEHLVITYYRSIAAADWPKAKACLSDELVQQYLSAPDSDFNNIKTLTGFKVTDVNPIIKHNGRDFVGPINGAYYDGVQVTVEYVAEYKEVIASNNGKQIRFIYVTKKEKDSPWQIVSIGTGP